MQVGLMSHSCKLAFINQKKTINIIAKATLVIPFMGKIMKST